MDLTSPGPAGPGLAPGASEAAWQAPAASASTMAGSTMAAQGGLALSIKRAFRVRIEPSDVQPAERATLELAGIHDAHHQAFLAWRRAVLLVVAVAFVPLTLLHFIEVFSAKGLPGIVTALQTLPVLAEGGLCALMWMQLRSWTRWPLQRRALLLGWLGYFLTPFVVYLYPIDSALRELTSAPGGAALGGNGGEHAMAAALGLMVSMSYSIQALLVLGPRVISLMPGLIRAALVSKLLFPGSPAPGWLIVLGSPIYALLVYVIVIIPYQVTGSGYFVLAMFGLCGAQLVLGRSGYRLARPTTHIDASSLVARARSAYLISTALGALFMLIALIRLVGTFHLGSLTVITTALSFAGNILLLTLVATDLVISNMEKARSVSIDAQAAIEESQLRLATFARDPGPGSSIS